MLLLPWELANTSGVRGVSDSPERMTPQSLAPGSNASPLEERTPLVWQTAMHGGKPKRIGSDQYGYTKGGRILFYDLDH